MLSFFFGSRGAQLSRRLAMSLSLILVASLFIAIDTSSAHAAPALENAPKVPDPSQLVAQDAIAAQIAARSRGHRVEVLSERTERATTWANPDGTLTTEESAGPVRIADSGQEYGWRTLDYTLEVKSDGTVGPKSGYSPITLSGKATAKQVAANGVVTSTGLRGKEVQFGWSEALPKPVLNGSMATYPDVLPSIDLVVELTASGFEQFFILKEKPELGEDVELRIPLGADGLKAIEQKDGGIDFTDSKNRFVGTIETPYMWDSSEDEGSGLPKNLTELTMDLEASAGGKKALVLTPDLAFLNDSALIYPVIIDPTFTGAPTFDTFVRSDFPTTDYGSHVELQVGTYNGGTTKARSYLAFSNSGWKGAAVTSATLKLYNFHSWSCTAAAMTVYVSGAPTAAVRWASQPSLSTTAGYYTSVTAAKGYNSSCAAGYVSIPVTALAQKQATTSASVVGYGLRASETANAAWKRFNSANATANKPSLSVTYNRYPSTATTPTVDPAQTIGSELYVSSLTPTFAAKAADADGGTTKILFEVDSDTTGSVVTSCTTGLVAQGTSASCISPPLIEGATYFVRAQSNDGANPAKAWSTYTKFVVQAGTPPMPTVSCPLPYSSGSWTGTMPASAVMCTVAVALPSGAGPQAYKLLTSVDGGNPKSTAIAAGSPGSGTVSIPITAGLHDIQVTAVSASGSTAVKHFQFGLGGAGISTPVSGVQTIDLVQISAAAAPKASVSATVTGVLKWRPANSGSTSWNTGPAVTVNSGNGVTPVTVSNFRWSSLSAVTDNTTGAAVTLNRRIPILLEIQLCFTYSSGGTKCTADNNVPATVLRVPHAFGDGFPVARAGEGAVALWTGELQLAASDAEVNTPAGGLSIQRSHSTFAGPQDSVTAVFGPGWTASFAGQGVGATGYQVIDSTTIDGTISLVAPGMDTLTFRNSAKGVFSAPTSAYFPVGATAKTGMRVSVTTPGTDGGKVLAFTSLDGTTTKWTPLSASAKPINWLPQSVTEAGAQGSETYTADAQGRVTRILAPVPAGVSCPESGALGPGCNALQITYAATTNPATGAFAGQVSSIAYTSYDPAISGMSTIPLATYKYDAGGRLVSVTKPQANSAPETTYSYAAASAGPANSVASVTTRGYAAFRYVYSTATPDNAWHLSQVTRDGWNSSAAVSVESSFVYGITPSNGASPSPGLPDFTPATAEKWGQTEAPTSGFAVFGADDPAPSSSAAVLTAAGSSWSTSHWANAQLYFTDANGYTVNTAEHGAGEWLRSAMSYDADGVEIARVGSSEIAKAEAADGSFQTVAEQPITRFNAGTSSLAQGTYVTDEWSTPFLAYLNNSEAQSLVRTHTSYEYDSGAPNGGIRSVPANPSIADAPYLQRTKMTVGVSATDNASSDPTFKLEPDLEINSVTIYGYDPIDGASNTGPTSGWTLGSPTVSTTVMSGNANNIVRSVRFDSSGNVVETREPLSNGADAGSMLTSTFTADAAASDTNCRNRPQWAGLPCSIKPAAAPAVGNAIIGSRIVSYSKWLDATEVIETSSSSSATRTTTVTHLPDGRPNTAAVTTTGLTGSTPLPKTQIQYDSATGSRTGTALLNSSDTITSSTSWSADRWGRTTGYTNAQGETTTTDYVLPGVAGAGQVSTVSTPSGSSTPTISTYSYNGTDAEGKGEHRGLPTGLHVTGVGSFSAAYNRDGALTTEIMPGGITKAVEFDGQGRVESMSYLGDVQTESGVSTAPWMSFSRDFDAEGRVSREWTPEGGTGLLSTGYMNAYEYDRAGRLETVTAATTDSSGAAACAVRQYSFNEQGNRVALNTATGPSCSEVVEEEQTYAYDNFSRQLTGADGVGSYVYDHFGRQTNIPAADAPVAADGDISMSYFDSDAVRSISQAGIVTQFSLDPQLRRLEETSNGANAYTTSHHFGNESDAPSYTVHTDSSSTVKSQYVNGLSGMAATVTTSGSGSTVTLALSDLGGSIVATAVFTPTANADSLTTYSKYGEYGNSAPSEGASSAPQYGWQGAAQRQVVAAGLLLMGARVYNPSTGTFTSPDPIASGNENSYNYPNDPINLRDLTGTRACDLTCDILLGTVGIAVAAICVGFFPGASLACLAVGGAVYGASKYLFQWAGTKKFSWYKLAFAAVVGALTYAIPLGILGVVGKIVVKVLLKLGKKQAASMVMKYWADLIIALRGKKH
jgi:RHS repeat-associated protein